MYEMAAAVNRKLRFNTQDDLYLLRETVEQNPFEDYSKWKSVTENVVFMTQKAFTVRAVREHVDHLIKLWKKEDFGNLRKSGTEEQYREKEQLLQETLSMKQEHQTKPRKKLRIEGAPGDEAMVNIPMIIVDEASIGMNSVKSEKIDFPEVEMEDFPQETITSDNESSENIRVDSDPIPGPSGIKQQHIKDGLLDYLRKREDDKRNKEMELVLRQEELEIQKRKLDIQERQIAVEERKLALEEVRIKEQLRLDALEQAERIKQSEQQRKLLDILIEKFCKEKNEPSV